MYHPQIGEFCYRRVEGRVEPFRPTRMEMWNYGYKSGKKPLYIEDWKEGETPKCSRPRDIYKTLDEAVKAEEASRKRGTKDERRTGKSI